MNYSPVCGYALPYQAADFHICPSCGTEFGYDDSGVSHAELRDRWIATGPSWWSPVTPVPPDWNPILQLMKGVFLSGTAHNTAQWLSPTTFARAPVGIFFKRKRVGPRIKTAGQANYFGTLVLEPEMRQHG